MKQIPKINVKPDHLFDLQFGATKAYILMAAVELNIFDITTKPLTSAEVAAAAKTHPQNTELFLNALVSVDLLEKKDGKFQNSEVTNAFLVSSSESFLGSYLPMFEQFLFKSKDQIKDAVKNGAPEMKQQEEMDADFFAQYTKLMVSATLSGITQAVAENLSRLPEFKGFKKMLDLGGAHGLDCIATLKKNPDMTGVVFDMPPVIAATKAIVSDFGMEDRVSLMGGDYISDPIGTDYDLVYAKGTLNFAGPALGDVIQKIYDSLNSGGVFVSIHEGLIDERTKPEGIVISWLQTGLTSVDVSLEENDIPDAMKAAGFTNIEILPFDFPMGGRLDMVIGRKK